MEIYYQGENITDFVQVVSCIVRDTAGNRCDSLEIEFENSAKWYAWGAEEDDQIVVTHKGYESGLMYVNKVLPENGRYRIIASSLPCKARTKGNKSFINKTIEEIMKSCAATSGMDYKIFGIDGKMVIPYAERCNEGCAAFLCKLLALEGALLKSINGRYTAIGIEYAQNMNAAQTIELGASQEGAQYVRDGVRVRRLVVKSPYAEGSAEDTLASQMQGITTISGALPVKNNMQATRWAKGKLLATNRLCESVTLKNEFNAGMTALGRVDITGNTDATGEWMVDDVEHDLVESKSTVTLRRCLWSIQ